MKFRYRNIIIFLFVLILIISLIFFGISKKSSLNELNPDRNEQNELQNFTDDGGQQGDDERNENGLAMPLDKASERVTKKFFGLYVSPENSPVKPERFQGYHTGVDFETFSDEENVDVAVYAVCDGKLLSKRFANGYGGLAVQSCEFDGKPFTVIYGHLALESITNNVEDELEAGDQLGILGKGYSNQTSGERKHLHLGIHKGSSVNILGYVPSQRALSDWINPCDYVCDDAR